MSKIRTTIHDPLPLERGKDFLLSIAPEQITSHPCIYLTYCGTTVGDALESLTGCLQSEHDIDSLVVQALWNFSLSACFAGLFYDDLHLENMVLRRIPSCRLRYAITSSDGDVLAVDFPTTFTFGVIDHVLDKDIPFTHKHKRTSRSSSSSKSTLTDPHFYVHMQTITIVLTRIVNKQNFKVNKPAAHARALAWFKYLTNVGSLSFVWFTTLASLIKNGGDHITLPLFRTVGDPACLAEKASSPTLPSNYFDTLYFASYFDFSPHCNEIAASVLPTKYSLSSPPRGRPRRYASAAEKQNAYRLRKRVRRENTGRGAGVDIFNISTYDTGLVYIDYSLCCPGLGVFARVGIPKGAYLTMYDGRVISHDFARVLKPWQKSHLRSRNKMVDCIDGIRLPCPLHGVASFINSTRNSTRLPNAKFLRDEVSLDIFAYALRDIDKNEEILINYEYEAYKENDNEVLGQGTKRTRTD